MQRVLAMILLAMTWSGCGSGGPHPIRSATVTLAGPADWLAWKAKRLESIGGTNGWTTLIARHWLNEGPNFVGSSPTNQLVFPRDRSPASIGNFSRIGRAVRFDPAPGVAATANGKPVESILDLTTDATGAPTRLVVGSLSFVVIERGERLGLRVRDPRSPARLHFRGIDCFPYDPAWRIDGRFEAFPEPKILSVQDVIGATQKLPSPGAIVFRVAGAEHRLEVVQEPDEEDYFVIFRDQSAGKSTYASGRFLYVAKPDGTGRVTIDFNRAYTPPCGFTPFATCPLPPRQNWLPFPIPAGERAPAGHP